jgi:hypothetical protein
MNEPAEHHRAGQRAADVRHGERSGRDDQQVPGRQDVG